LLHADFIILYNTQLKIKGYPLDDIKEIEVKKHYVHQEEELIGITQNKENNRNIE